MGIVLSLFSVCVLIVVGILSSLFKDALKAWILQSFPSNLEFMPRELSSLVSNLSTFLISPMIIWILQAFLLQWRLGPGFNFSVFASCENGVVCIVNQAAARVCGANTLLSVGMLLGVLLAKDTMMYEVHKLGISHRLAFVLLFTIVLSLVPNYIMNTYMNVAVMSSVGYQMIQTMILIDLAYKWNDIWKQKAENVSDPKRQYSVIIFTAVFLFSLSFFVNTTVYRLVDSTYFKGIVSLFLITFVCLTVFSVTVLCPNGALLTSTAMFSYGTLLVMSSAISILRSSSESILPNIKSTTWYFVMLWIICICHSALTSPMEPESDLDLGIENRPLGLENKGLNQRRASSTIFPQNETVKQTKPKSPLLSREAIKEYRVFHLLLIFASFQLFLITTNWMKPSIKQLIPDEKLIELSKLNAVESSSHFASLVKHPLVERRLLHNSIGEVKQDGSVVTMMTQPKYIHFVELPFTFWIEILGGSLASVCLYGWTLVAPILIPFRDFS